MFSVEAFFGSLNSNKEALQKVHEATDDPITGRLSGFWSLRAESNVSSRNYVAYCNEFTKLPDWTEHSMEHLARYVELRLGTIRGHSSVLTDVGHALAMDDVTCAVDRYGLLCESIKLVLSHGSHAQQSAACSVARFLARRVSDDWLRTLVSILDPELKLSEQCISREVLDVLDLYTSSKYPEVITACTGALANDPTQYVLYDLLAKACAHSRTPPPRSTTIGGEIVIALHSVLTQEPDAGASLLSIEKYSQIFRPFGMGEFLSSWLRDWEDRVNESVEPAHWAAQCSLTPRSSLGAEDTEASLVLLGRFLDRSPGSLTALVFREYFRSIRDGDRPSFPGELPESRAEKYRALASEQQGDHIVALGAYDRLSANENLSSRVRKSAIEGKVRCLLALGDVERATRILAHFCLGSGVASDHIVRITVAARKHKHSTGVHEALDAAVLLQVLHTRDRSAVNREEIFDAYEDVLAAASEPRPSKLPSESEHGRALIFFLREVCVPEIMDSSIHFESVDDLEGERIAVCERLRALDPEQEDRFREEIATLTYRSKIRQALHRADQSKVHVDTDGIRERLGDQFEERFSRFQLLGGLQSELRVVYRTQNMAVIRLVKPDEHRVVFRDLIRSVADAFLYDNECGLDSNLSTHIRHGRLAGQIRSPFEGESLVTRLNPSNQEYLPNEQWPKKLQHSSAGASAVDEHLASLSKTVDRVTLRMRSRWIQVRSPEHPDGLFDHGLDDGTRLDALYKEVRDIEDVDDFIASVFDWLWDRTEENLTHVRERLAVWGSGLLMQKLIRTQENIELLAADTTSVRDFRDAISRCRTNLQRAFSQVESWFQLSQNIKLPELEPVVAVHAAIETANRLHPGLQFVPEVVVSIRDPLKGRAFRGLLGLLEILLENVLQHSGIRQNPPTKIELSKELGRVILCVTNALHETVDSDDLASRLPALEGNCNERAQSRHLRREGGSGYYKLGKILRRDLGRVTATVALRITPKRDFECRVRMEQEELFA